MKFFEIFNITDEKIGEMAQFSDGWCYLHYTIENIYPKNEWGRSRAMKIAITKRGWKYKVIKNEK